MTPSLGGWATYKMHDIEWFQSRNHSHAVAAPPRIATDDAANAAVATGSTITTVGSFWSPLHVSVTTVHKGRVASSVTTVRRGGDGPKETTLPWWPRWSSMLCCGCASSKHVV